MFESRHGASDSMNMFSAGKAVYDRHQVKVATLSAYEPEAGYFIAHKGILFPHDLYIPNSAITRNDASGIYLNLSKDELKDDRYATPQTGTRPLARDAETATAASAGAIGAGSSTLASDRVSDRVTDRVSDRVSDRVTDRAEPVATERDTEAARTLDTASKPGLTARGVGPSEVEDISVPLREETLIANKTREQIGRVHVQRYVVEESQTVEEPVAHEEVSIEHVTGTTLPVGADVFTDKDIDVPLMGERLNLGKETHVAEEVHLHKRLITEQQRASGQVRKERIRVEGDAQDLASRVDPSRVDPSRVDRADPPRVEPWKDRSTRPDARPDRDNLP